MFTGIVEEMGTIRQVVRRPESCVLHIEAGKILDDIHIGDSIAVNGVCLTVTGILSRGFCADVMHETLLRSSMAGIRAGSRVNLERALAVGGRFGGHIVSGHIDGTGRLAAVEHDGIAVLLTIRAAPELTRGIVEKGSVALDGISLTVVSVSEEAFRVSVIPHTFAATTLGQKHIGDTINIENDVIGKYVEKLLGIGGNAGKAAAPPEHKAQTGLTEAFLTRCGF